MCRTEYRVTKVSDTPEVFVVIPDMEGLSSNGSDKSSKETRRVSTEVFAAFSVFGLDESATFDQVRSAYRRLLKGFHPDKVAHLGPEWQRNANAKTKALNSAYRILKEFFAA